MLASPSLARGAINSTGIGYVNSYRLFRFSIAAMILAVLPVAASAQSQPYPNRVIHIIVPFPPGGLNDNVARIVQPF